jgi:WD40 repeat protein
VTFARSRAVRFDSRKGVFWALDREGVLTHRTVQGPSVTVKLPSPVREDDEPEIELSPDGQWLAYPAHDGVWLVSQTGDTRHLLPLGTNLDGTPESLNVLDWSPDGRRLLVATSRFLPKTTSSSWVNGNSTRPTFLLASLSLDSGELTPLGVRGRQGRWGPSTVR